ncbi:MAG TPA: hypothetical protein VFZ24_10795 [Longimicrobiales bacterium]
MMRNHSMNLRVTVITTVPAIARPRIADAPVFVRTGGMRQE